MKPGACEWTREETRALRLLDALRVVIVAAALPAGVAAGLLSGIEQGIVAGAFTAMLVNHVGALAIEHVTGVRLFGRSTSEGQPVARGSGPAGRERRSDTWGAR